MNDYFSSRFTYDPKREVIWKQICKFIQRYIPPDSTVLDLGAGYCDFINNIKAKKKIAIDTSDQISKFANKDVETFKTSCENIKSLKNDSIDVVFASNIFEHLEKKKFRKSLREIKRLLKKDGLIIVLQPNYIYCFKEYFDDYTHKSVFSHVSLSDYLTSEGFCIERCYKKFLPFSMKSKLPKPSFLVWLYLRLPLKLFAKQMLIIGRLKTKACKGES